MDSRPTPTGYQHFVEVRLGCVPDARFTDPVRALADLEAGLAQPVVEVIEKRRDGGVVVRVSVFSEDSQPTHDEAAAVYGLVAELTYADGGGVFDQGRVGSSRM